MANYLVSSSPHITSKRTTRRIMLDVIIALTPAVIAAFFLYGLYTLFLIGLSVASCVFFEHLFCLITRKKSTVKDLSAVVTGIILALNLPPVVPFYVVIIGALFAIVVVKMLFGGIGRNFANPAITARIFLMLAWTGVITRFVTPIDLSQGASELVKYLSVDSIFKMNWSNGLTGVTPSLLTTGATPLASVKDAILSGGNPAAGLSALDMFLGRIGGSAGEVSALALIIGGIYLAIRKVIDIKIPLIFIGTVAVFTAIFFAKSPYCGEFVWTYMLGGGLMLGAIFMATDYASSPNTNFGKIIFAFGCGLLTVVFRKYSSMPEGVSYAILLMNIASPLLDKIVPKPYGHPKKSIKDVMEGFKAKFSKKDKEVKEAE